MSTSTLLQTLGVLLIFLSQAESLVIGQTLFGEGIPWHPKRTVTNRDGSVPEKQPKPPSDEPSLIVSTSPDPYIESWPNTIAVCAIMFNESAQDVEEFLRYYRWIGVDSFFIRENSKTSQLHLVDVLKPYQTAGILDYALRPGSKFRSQTPWYNECAELASKKHSWVAFIDLDEFMVILRRGKAVTERNALKHLLNDRFRYNAVVSVQWVLFGSGGHKDPPPLGQLEGFQKCTGVLAKQMKCIGSSYWFNKLNPFQPIEVHRCFFQIGGIAVLGNGDPLPMEYVVLETKKTKKRKKTKKHKAISYPGHLFPYLHPRYTKLRPNYHIIINHYVTRSQNRFIERKIKLKSGVYGTTFAKIVKENGSQRRQDQLFAQFEKEYGFDGDHNICHQGALAGAAMRAALDAGDWDPIASTPELPSANDGGTKEPILG